VLVLGVAETIEFVDGSSELAVMRFVSGIDEVVAFAAPAFAGAADSVIAAPDKIERRRLTNRVETLLGKCATTSPVGFGRQMPETIYQMLPFSEHAIDEFVRIREAMPDKMDIYDAQTFAIIMAEDAEVILLDSERSREVVESMHAAGLIMKVRWIAPNASDN